MIVDVQELLFDDANVAKLHAHGISVRMAIEVADEAPAILLNYAKGGARYLLVGPDLNGTFVTLPIDPTHEYGLYRPRTGYASKPRDVGRYYKKRASR